jgi:hypothetical protein
MRDESFWWSNLLRLSKKINFKIMFKIFSIGLLSILLGVTATRTWSDLWEGDEYIAKLAHIEAGHYPAMIMGDSVIKTTYGDPEGQRQTVDQLLSEALGEPVVDLSRSGMHLNSHVYLLDWLAFKQVTSDVFFLEINPILIMCLQDTSAFRSWKKHLELVRKDWNMAYRLFQYALYLDKKALGASESKTKEKDSKHFLGKDFREGIRRLSARNKVDLPELVQLIQQAAKTCLQIAPKVVFFITPINVMRLRIDCSRHVQNYHQKVVDTIATTCETLPITFINLYQALPDSRYFSDTTWSHLTYEGRKFLAEQLVTALKEKEF